MKSLALPFSPFYARLVLALGGSFFATVARSQLYFDDSVLTLPSWTVPSGSSSSDFLTQGWNLSSTSSQAYSTYAYSLSFAPLNLSLNVTMAGDTGNAKNTVSSNLILSTDVTLNNLLNQSLTVAGTVDTSGNTLTVEGTGKTVFASNVTGGGEFAKAGTGTVQFDGSISLGTLTLSGGTLLLDSASLATTTLHITGNSILDFGTAAGSVFNVTNLIVDSGVTLTIKNWTNATDYFYAQNNPGKATLSQVSFTGFGADAWQSFDKQIKPVPEPGTYGAIFMGASVGFYGLLSWRRARRASALAL